MNKIKQTILLVFFISISMMSFAKTTIRIRNQQDFDLLQERLLQSINSGENVINIIFQEGCYVAKEKQISLIGVNAPSTKIFFKGKKAVIVPQGNVYQNGGVYKGSFSPYNSWMDGTIDIDVWSNVKYAKGLIEIIDPTNKKCRLKSKEYYPATLEVSDSYILIPHGYQSSVYKIDKYTDGYFYFTASDLQNSAKSGFNINDDYNYHKREIRYKLSNISSENLRVKEGRIYLPFGVSSIREGQMQHYFFFENCNLQSITIKGLNLQGNQSNSYVSSRAAIYFNNVQSQKVMVQDCSFIGIKINVISALSTPNVQIVNNYFSDCYYRGIESDNNSRNTEIRNNTFIRMGKRMQNSFCVICRGTDYKIADNSFTDYGYSAIGGGVWYKSKQENPCNGVIENNALLYTNEYMTDIDNYGIMDGGAIYLWTKNDGVVIRYNVIQNYSGAGDNRGIFCDDGAYNYEIYGNLITGISNSYCIDSRRVSTVEVGNTPESGIIHANVNNVIRDNYIDGGIQFVGNEIDNNGCRKGKNYLISNSNLTIKQTIKNAEETEDIFIESAGVDEDRIIVKPTDYKQLRHSCWWKGIKRYVMKSR